MVSSLLQYKETQNNSHLTEWREFVNGLHKENVTKLHREKTMFSSSHLLTDAWTGDECAFSRTV